MCVNVQIGGYLALKRMDPRNSATLLGLLGRVPRAESLPQQFPLLFPNAQTSCRFAMPEPVGRPDNSTSQVSHTQRVGTQVNVISGGNSFLSVGSKGDSITDQEATAASKLSPIDIPIKVIHLRSVSQRRTC